jgi:hypothetical protein
MSDTDSNKSPIDDSSEYDPDVESYDGQFINDRAEHHSDESSSYYFTAQVDPNSKNKKYVRRVNPETKRSVRVDFFPTSTTPSIIIKHAINGTYQGYDRHFFRVGTKDEDLFFSVILATGELGQNPPTLFYDNPEQYENHFFTKVPQKLKDAWNVKKNAALFQLNLRQINEANEERRGIILVK